MNYIYSTLSADTAYAVYVTNNDRDISVIDKSILVKGGTGVLNKHFVTPRGVVTQVTDEELEILMNDYHFKQHMENGFIKVEKKEKEVQDVYKDMVPKDGGAQKTPDDYEGTTSSQPVVDYTKSIKKGRK